MSWLNAKKCRPPDSIFCNEELTVVACHAGLGKAAPSEIPSSRKPVNICGAHWKSNNISCAEYITFWIPFIHPLSKN